MYNIKKFKKELQNSNLIPVFEIEVINKETKESDWIVFNIEIDRKNIASLHEPLTIEQKNSDKIAYVGIELDSDFYELV